VYVSDNPVINAQHVVFEAAKAHRNGLKYHVALAGVTSASAELLGLGERIGKVKAGFDADVVVWDSVWSILNDWQWQPTDNANAGPACCRRDPDSGK
jgi:predicted amidohydrolase YtcJ